MSEVILGGCSRSGTSLPNMDRYRQLARQRWFWLRAVKCWTLGRDWLRQILDLRTHLAREHWACYWTSLEIEACANCYPLPISRKHVRSAHGHCLTTFYWEENALCAPASYKVSNLGPLVIYFVETQWALCIPSFISMDSTKHESKVLKNEFVLIYFFSCLSLDNTIK